MGHQLRVVGIDERLEEQPLAVLLVAVRGVAVTLHAEAELGVVEERLDVASGGLEVRVGDGLHPGRCGLAVPLHRLAGVVSELDGVVELVCRGGMHQGDPVVAGVDLALTEVVVKDDVARRRLLDGRGVRVVTRR